MQPLSGDLPKALMPFWNEPLLARAIERLRAWGVKKILINLHHGAHQILEFVTGRQWGVSIDLSFEPEILGTGGAIARASWFLDETPFWIMNSDIVADVSPNPLLKEIQNPRVLAALWMDPRRGPRTVDLRRGDVHSFTTANPGGPNTFTFCGVHLVQPGILEFLPKSGFVSIIDAYRAAMRRDHRIRGVVIDGSNWAGLGSPASYLAAHAAHRGSKRFRAIDAGAHIPRQASVQNSVLWKGCRVRSGARLRNVIAGRDCDLAGGENCIAVRADRTTCPAVAYGLTRTRWNAEDTTVYLFRRAGSRRDFYRLQCGNKTAFAVDYDPQRTENELYVGHAQFLRNLGIRVPEILHSDEAQHRFMMQDLGDVTLETAVPASSPARVRRLYRLVIDDVARMHKCGLRAARKVGLKLNPPFGPAAYRAEHDCFLRYFAGSLPGLSAQTLNLLKRDLAFVASHLPSKPTALMHRDLQSSNVLVHRGHTYLIDFQGMRAGIASYDAASLIFDPYVSISRATREGLMDEYLERVGDDGTIRQQIPWAAIQRLTQTLGAFGRLAQLAGNERFLGYIEPTRKILLRLMKPLAGIPALKGLCGEPLIVRDMRTIPR